MERFGNLRSALCLSAIVTGLAACGQSPTAVRIEVAYGALAVQQIEFTLLSADRATEIVAPTVRPAVAGAPLPSPQSIVVLLPDRAATVICRARLLTTPDRQREQSADVRPHAVTNVSIVFTDGDGDASANDLAVDRPLDAGVGDAGATDTRVPDAPAGDITVADAPEPDAADAASEAGSDAAPAGKANGDTCSQSSECASSFCADGICCDTACTGKCLACNLVGSAGTCMPIPAGYAAPSGDCAAQPASGCGDDGTCDGAGACRKYPTGTECTPASCASGKVMSSATCDGRGTCVAGALIDCAPFLCDPASTRCYQSCTSSGQCAPGRTCDASGLCGLKPLGARCSGSSECNGGAVCANGVCCSTACDRSCFLCNLPGREGLCTAVPAGSLDPKGLCVDGGKASCGDNGLCDGAGACQRYPLGAVCLPQACGGTAGKQVVPAKTCDSAGACSGPAPTSCANKFACVPDAGTCYVAPCTADDQCVATCNKNNGKCR
jgi:hypothetical protein